jgi:corrinoid protein of di/trimethylamine methyltransferase
MVDFNLISEALQKGRAKDVEAMVTQALAENVVAKDILEQGLMTGMSLIGARFKKNEVFVPEVLIAARAMNAGMKVLKPALVTAGVEARGTVILGTVKGDLHDIGKNLVGMMMEGAGLRVVDIGTDVPAEKFIEAAKAENAQIIACSALLTTTMTQMKNVVQAAESAGIRDKVKIMVGGAPVTDTFCAQIGADKYSADAATAAEVAAAFCN